MLDLPKLSGAERVKFAVLQDVALRNGYSVEFQPKARAKRNGWPVASSKPFALYINGGGARRGHVASFATLDQLDRAFRRYAGL